MFVLGLGDCLALEVARLDYFLLLGKISRLR